MLRRLFLLLAAFTALALTSLAGIATAATTGVGAQTRVGAPRAAEPSFTGAIGSESPCSRPGSIGSAAEVTSGFCVAAEDAVGGGARFIVGSSGDTRIFLNSGEGSVEVTQHAALRITQRGLTLDRVEGVLQDEQSFQYFHAGQWKTGYYDPNGGVFVGTANGNVTTVINGAKPSYIANLKGAQP